VGVGRDDNTSLGKISGGTTPARIWRQFAGSAMAIDRDSRQAPALPFRRPTPAPRQSPVPDDWAAGILEAAGKALQEILDQ